MYELMRIVDEEGDVYYLEGNDEMEAKASFGYEITIEHLVANPVNSDN